MARFMTFLKRRPELERPAFLEWWLGPHRELASALPGLRRYVISTAATPEDGDFDGLAELWFDDAPAAAAALESEAGRAARADTAAHAARVERLAVTEHPFVETGRPAGCKLVAALKRRPGLERAAFARWWLEHHAPMVVRFPELARYQVSLVEGAEEGFADGVAEVCFPDLETLERVMYTDHVRGVQADADDHVGGRCRLIVEEHPVLS